LIVQLGRRHRSPVLDLPPAGQGLHVAHARVELPGPVIRIVIGFARETGDIESDLAFLGHETRFQQQNQFAHPPLPDCNFFIVLASSRQAVIIFTERENVGTGIVQLVQLVLESHTARDPGQIQSQGGRDIDI